MDKNSFFPVPFEPGLTLIASILRADLDDDGESETLDREEEGVTILSGEKVVWESPPEWEVIQADFTDLDRDIIPEVSLLVWRPFKPWPVDEFLPYGGRIAGHQDDEGNSCHLILIGWTRDGYGELWAGSALAYPVTTFRVADLNGDTFQELITLQGEYSHKGSTHANILNVWEWNGFGFTIVYSQEGYFSDLAMARTGENHFVLLTP